MVNGGMTFHDVLKMQFLWRDMVFECFFFYVVNPRLQHIQVTNPGGSC